MLVNGFIRLSRAYTTSCRPSLDQEHLQPGASKGAGASKAKHNSIVASEDTVPSTVSRHTVLRIIRLVTFCR